MQETLSLRVNASFDKQAVCTKYGHQPFKMCIYTTRACNCPACIPHVERL
jgi:hypothetical protein